MPYDSSHAANLALDHAVHLAKSLGSQLIILHVIPEIRRSRIKLDSHESDPDLEEIYIAEKLVSVYETMTKVASIELEARRKEYGHEGVTIRTEVKVGHVVDSIVDFAKKEKVGLIVISNIGSGAGTSRSPLGSVSRSVAERAFCPVLVVRHSA